MNKKVKVLNGLFRGEIGELHKTFQHNGKTMYVIRICKTKEGYKDTTPYYSFATVEDGEFEYVK